MTCRRFEDYEAYGNVLAVAEDSRRVPVDDRPDNMAP